MSRMVKLNYGKVFETAVRTIKSWILSRLISINVVIAVVDHQVIYLITLFEPWHTWMLDWDLPITISWLLFVCQAWQWSSFLLQRLVTVIIIVRDTLLPYIFRYRCSSSARQFLGFGLGSLLTWLEEKMWVICNKASHKSKRKEMRVQVEKVSNRCRLHCYCCPWRVINLRGSNLPTLAPNVLHKLCTGAFTCLVIRSRWKYFYIILFDVRKIYLLFKFFFFFALFSSSTVLFVLKMCCIENC